MNNQEALAFAEERLDKISYQLETSNNLPCRSFYEKQQDMLIKAVLAMQEKQDREKGCLSCKGDEWYFNRWCWIDEKGDPCHQEIKFCPICGRDLRKPV